MFNKVLTEYNNFYHDFFMKNVCLKVFHGFNATVLHQMTTTRESLVLPLCQVIINYLYWVFHIFL